MNAFTVMAALLVSPQPGASDTACPAISPAGVEAQFERFNAAWATQDPDVVTALFTEEPVLLPTLSNVPRTTRESIRDYFVGFLRNRPVGRIDTSSVEIDCRTASRVGTWTVTLTDPASGAARDVAARYSFIYRFEQGDWKIDHLHSSVMPGQ
ncbi:SgcJ/EcaC family oxidoreductase [Brevundimonas sp.]|uniref:SgcJ/EcaC family oxidoreductase n=1 Tax=Brevundimonas sp. TaxID=1871086 RepID=UPI002627CE48|nr:SgcJ/EcaC family oxidoreductase [Brevundimonas sp.]